jgi:hypothetical protein
VPGTAAGTDTHRVSGATAGREEEGRRGGASRRRGCSRDFNGVGGSSIAPRGKREGQAGSNLRKTRLSTVSPPERRTTAAGAQIPVRG